MFICVCTVGWFWLYFFLPETKGVPLEEMAEKFGDRGEVVVYLRELDIDSKAQDHGVAVRQEIPKDEKDGQGVALAEKV